MKNERKDNGFCLKKISKMKSTIIKKSKFFNVFNFAVVLMQMVIAATFIISASAQPTDHQEGNMNPWSNKNYMFDEQPALSVYTTLEAASAMPSALLTGNASEINDVTVWNNSSNNHLLVLVINTVRKNLTTEIYDSKGYRVKYEMAIETGIYRLVEHLGNLRPGKYFLKVMERGVLIAIEEFDVKG